MLVCVLISQDVVNRSKIMWFRSTFLRAREANMSTTRGVVISGKGTDDNSQVNGCESSALREIPSVRPRTQRRTPSLPT